jgi:hypothetical protein
MTLRLTAIAISVAGGCILATSGCASSSRAKAVLNQLSSSNSAQVVVASSNPATTPATVTLSAVPTAATPSYTVAPLSSAQTAALGYPPHCPAGGETIARAQLNLRNLDPPSGQPGNYTQGVHTILLRTLKPGSVNVRWFRSGGAASSPVFTGYLQIAKAR